MLCNLCPFALGHMVKLLVSSANSFESVDLLYCYPVIGKKSFFFCLLEININLFNKIKFS